ncbi:MAG: hypothetical protein BIFFINMI_02359 [Phycisphaerae bacterium]|nr:hypothetical protein [Phycisphaerae bacterium]
MDVKRYLSRNHVPFQTDLHAKAVTAQEVAEIEHIPGDELAKPVILTLPDESHVMFVCPACYRVDLSRAREILESEVRLAHEEELGDLFRDCEVGAEPPFGSQYGLWTYVDESLAGREHITFRAGTHTETVTMSWSDYERIEQPRIARFARHV